MLDTETVEEELAALVAGERLANPYVIFNAAREAAPVHQIGDSYMVLRHEDVVAVLSDGERFSFHAFIRGTHAMKALASLPPDGQELWHKFTKTESDLIGTAPHGRHTLRRNAVHRYLTPRRILAINATIEGFVDELLAEAQEQEVYDHKRLVSELALRVVTDIIGAPQVDREFLRKMVSLRAHGEGATNVEALRKAYDAHMELDAYVREVIIAEQRSNRDSNEFAASLMAAGDEGRLSTEEIVGVVITIVQAGVHTTSCLLTVGLMELLTHPDQWRALCADPSLVPSAIEELLRYISPSQCTQRIADEDLTWRGYEIPAETTMFVAIAAAARDPRIYENPDALDIRRSPQHASLGQGLHFCLGASVIRNEARALLSAMATRFPNVSLAIDPADIDYTGGTWHARGLQTLPVSLNPTST